MLRMGFLGIMENKLSLNLERISSVSSMDWQGDLYNVDKITEFPLSFISNIKHSFNREILRTFDGRRLS